MKDDIKSVERLLDVMDERKFHPQFCMAASALTYQCGKSDELRRFIIDNDITEEDIVDTWLDENIDYDEITDGDDEDKELK